MYNKEDFSRLLEMGFTKEAIEKAYKIAYQRKVPVLDVLTNNMQQPLSNNYTHNNAASATQRNSAQQHRIQPAPQFVYRPFWVQKAQINLEGYDCIYDLSNPRSQQSSLGFSNQNLLERREQGVPVALLNVSNCCYLNSLLQAYFLMPKVFRVLLEAQPLNKEQLSRAVPNSIRNKRITNSHKLLKSVQWLISQMALSTSKQLDPSEVLSGLVDSVGNRLSYGQQKDLSEINEGFISMLQECTAYTSNNPGYVGDDKPPTSPLDPLLFGQKVQISNGSEESQIKSKFFGILLGYKHGSVSNALNEEFHYTVESEDRKIQKDVWITKAPEYLFFYVQRTAYDRNKGVMKIREKIGFDFVMYLDRHMYKNRSNKNNALIQEQVSKKEALRQELLAARALMKNLDNCASLLQRINSDPPPIVLPQHRQPLTAYMSQLEAKMQKCDEIVNQLETREQKYLLKYVVMHRGRADSGHYWGYGLVGEQWWRLDITCGPINKAAMMKQIEQGDAVVYALVYSRGQADILPNYKHYLSEEANQRQINSSYWGLVPKDTRLKILRNNVLRQKDFSSKKLHDDIAAITQQYEQRLRRVEEAVATYNLNPNNKSPLLRNLSEFIRWNSTETTQALKTHLLDITLRHVVGKSIVDTILTSTPQNEHFKSQLLDSFKHNLSKADSPDKLTMSKIEYEKLLQRFQQFKRQKKCQYLLLKCFESILVEKWNDATRLVYFAVSTHCKSYLKKVGQQILEVLVVKQVIEGGFTAEKVAHYYIEAVKFSNPTLYDNMAQLQMLNKLGSAANQPLPTLEGTYPAIDQQSKVYAWPLKQAQSAQIPDDLVQKHLQSTYPRLLEWVRKTKSINQKAVKNLEELKAVK